MERQPSRATLTRLCSKRRLARDTIVGFNASDVIEIAAGWVSDWNALLAHTTQFGSDTLIILDPSDVITLANVQKSSLALSEFAFK